METMVEELTKLRPERLQAFAAAHQNDTMALLAAKAASDAQKKMMAARPAQQMGIPPKVNEQVVESIAQPQAPQKAPQDQGLPEESGIAQLPAPNMQGMAGGGIVAFSTGNLVRGQEESFEDFRRRLFDAELQAQRDANAASDQEREAERQRYLAAQGENNRVPPSPFFNRAPLPALKKSAVALAPIAALNTATMPTDATRRGDIRFPASADGALKPVSAPLYQRESAGGSGTGAGGSGTRAPQGGGLTELYKKTLAAQGEATDPYEAERNEVMKSRQAMAGEELTDAKARKEGLAALLGGRESRIKGREERAEKSENLNTKMAVINAGLAMMQSTGRGLAGIAEGATKGMGMYAEGLKLTAAERQKIEDAKDSFDELKFNSENLTQKEITAAKNKVSEVANMTKEKHIEALMKREDINRETAGKLFEATVRQNEGALDRANRVAVAGMPGREERLAAIIGAGGPQAEALVKGIQELKAIEAGKFSVPTEYSKYLQEWVKSGGVAGPKMSMAEFAQQFGRVVTQPGAGSRP
jgi:hypothetical protein